MMKGTEHGPNPFDIAWEAIKHNLRVVHNVHAEVADIAFERGYAKGYEEWDQDTINDHYAALADGLADEARDGYFRGKADAESEKGEAE